VLDEASPSPGGARSGLTWNSRRAAHRVVVQMVDVVHNGAHGDRECFVTHGAAGTTTDRAERSELAHSSGVGEDVHRM
jgi:hypothetical protein